MFIFVSYYCARGKIRENTACCYKKYLTEINADLHLRLLFRYSVFRLSLLSSIFIFFLIKSLIYARAHRRAHGRTGPLAHGRTDAPAHRCTGALAHWRTGALAAKPLTYTLLPVFALYNISVVIT